MAKNRKPREEEEQQRKEYDARKAAGSATKTGSTAGTTLAKGSPANMPSSPKPGTTTGTPTNKPQQPQQPAHETKSGDTNWEDTMYHAGQGYQETPQTPAKQLKDPNSIVFAEQAGRLQTNGGQGYGTPLFQRDKGGLMVQRLNGAEQLNRALEDAQRQRGMLDNLNATPEERKALFDMYTAGGGVQGVMHYMQADPENVERVLHQMRINNHQGYAMDPTTVDYINRIKALGETGVPVNEDIRNALDMYKDSVLPDWIQNLDTSGKGADNPLRVDINDDAMPRGLSTEEQLRWYGNSVEAARKIRDAGGYAGTWDPELMSDEDMESARTRLREYKDWTHEEIEHINDAQTEYNDLLMKYTQQLDEPDAVRRATEEALHNHGLEVPEGWDWNEGNPFAYLIMDYGDKLSQYEKAYDDLLSGIDTEREFRDSYQGLMDRQLTPTQEQELAWAREYFGDQNIDYEDVDWRNYRKDKIDQEYEANSRYDESIAHLPEYNFFTQNLRRLRNIGGKWDADTADLAYAYANDIDFRDKLDDNTELGMEAVIFAGMTPSELADFNYTYKTRGRDAALAVLDQLRPKLNARYTGVLENNRREFATEGPLEAALSWGTARGEKLASALATPIAMGSALLGGQGLDPNSHYYQPQRMANASDMAQSQRAGEIWNTKIPGFDKPAGSILFDALTSAADSATSAAVGKFVGGAKAGKQIAQFIMSSNAAGNTFAQALEDRRSVRDAVLDATADGVIEAFTESVGLDALVNPNLSKGAFRRVMEGAFIEGSEELNGNFLNKLYDTVMGKVLGRRTEHDRNVGQQLMFGQHEDGTPFSVAEARGNVGRQELREAGQAFGEGALSGGLMIGGQEIGMIGKRGAAGKAVSSETSRNSMATIAEGLGMQQSAEIFRSSKSGNRKLGIEAFHIQERLADRMQEVRETLVPSAVESMAQANALEKRDQKLITDAITSGFQTKVDGLSEAGQKILDKIRTGYQAILAGSKETSLPGQMEGALRELTWANNAQMTVNAMLSGNSMVTNNATVNSALDAGQAVLDSGKSTGVNNGQRMATITNEDGTEIRGRVIGISETASQNRARSITPEQAAEGTDNNESRTQMPQPTEEQKQGGARSLTPEQLAEENQVTTDEAEPTTEPATETTEDVEALPEVEGATEKPGITLTLETEDGRTIQVDADSVDTFDDDAVATIVQMAQNRDSGLTTDELNGMLNAYKGGDVTTYVTGYTDAYNAGYYGRNMASTTGVILDQQTIEAAQEAGRKAHDAFEARRLAIAAQAGTKRNGKFTIDSSVHMKSLDANQKAGVMALKGLSKVLGINVGIYESTADETGKYTGKNGWYDPSTHTIYIDVNAGRNYTMEGYARLNAERKANGEPELSVPQYALLKTAAHELTHYIENGTGQEYAALRSFMENEYRRRGYNFEAMVQTKIQHHQDLGVNLTREGAISEIIADGCEMMLQDSQALTRLMKEHGNVFEKMSSLLHKISDNIKKAFTGASDPAHAESAALMELDDEGIYHYSQDMVKLWDDAIFAAAGITHTDGVSAREAASTLMDAGDAELEQTHPGAVAFSVRQLSDAMGWQMDMTPIMNIPYRLLDKNGNPVTSVSRDMVMSAPAGNVIRAALLNKTITQDQANAIADYYARMAEMSIKYKDAATVWELVGTNLFSAIKNNSDKQYSTTVDMGTVCSKTQAIIDVISDAMVEKGRGLTRAEVIDAYRNTYNAGLSVPCPVCYVFSRWMGVPSLLQQIKNSQERYGNMTAEQLTEYVRQMDEKYKTKDAMARKRSTLEKKLDALIEQTQERLRLEGPNADIGNLRTQMEAAEKELGELQAYNFVTQVILKQKRKGKSVVQLKDEKTGLYIKDPAYKEVPPDTLFDLRKGDKFAHDYEKVWTFRTTRGAGMGKAILPYSGHTLGDAIYAQQKRVSDAANVFLSGDKKRNTGKTRLANAVKRAMAQNLIGGQRFQSTSDFRPEWGVDYLMSFAEMQMIGSKGQLYTKVIEAVDLFATANIMVNCSIMPEGDGYITLPDGTRKLVFSSVTGIDFDAAYQKTLQYGNVQMILVGINDDHIRMAMADNRIQFIIPWHSSGNSKDTLKQLVQGVGETLNTTTDYSDYQNDKVREDQTEEQKKLWEIRSNILTGAYHKKNSTLNEDMATIQSDPFLSDLYRRFYVDRTETDTYDVRLTSEQASQIFPYEYWDKNSTLDTADINGQLFVDYCEHFGYQPRFEQFKDDPGYWKLLIDRRMYGLDGQYQDAKAIDVQNINVEAIPMSASQAKYGDVDAKARAVQALIDEMKAHDKARDFDSISDQTVSETENVQYSSRDVPENSAAYIHFDSKAEEATALESSDAGTQFSIREEAPPKKTMYAYKAFYARDGKLYPPMVSNITDESDKQRVNKATSNTMRSLDTPVGVWLNADVGGIAVDENGVPLRAKTTGRLRVKNDKGGDSLAFRPGWHLGEWPDAKQFNKTNPRTGEAKSVMPDDLVFALCEVAADRDYQLEAISYGVGENGKFNRSQAGLPYLPQDGYYKYRTNPDPATAPWLITGAMRVVEILDDDDCARICAQYGVKPDERYSGKKINLADYGLKRGPVDPTVDVEPYRKNEASFANDRMLQDALNDENYSEAYVQRDINFDDPKVRAEFELNGQSVEDYQRMYEERAAEDIRYSLREEVESEDNVWSYLSNLDGFEDLTVKEKAVLRNFKLALDKVNAARAQVERYQAESDAATTDDEKTKARNRISVAQAQYTKAYNALEAVNRTDEMRELEGRSRKFIREYLAGKTDAEVAGMVQQYERVISETQQKVDQLREQIRQERARVTQGQELQRAFDKAETKAAVELERIDARIAAMEAKDASREEIRKLKAEYDRKVKEAKEHGLKGQELQRAFDLGELRDQADRYRSTIKQIRSDASQRLLNEQNRYRAMIQNNRDIQKATARAARAKRQAVRDIKWLDSLIRKEDDYRNVPEELKPLVETLLSMVAAHDEGGASIAWNKKQAQRLTQMYANLLSQDSPSGLNFDDSILAMLENVSDLMDSITGANRLTRARDKYGRLVKQDPNEPSIRLQRAEQLATAYAELADIVKYFKHTVRGAQDLFIAGKRMAVSSVNAEVMSQLPKNTKKRYTGPGASILSKANQSFHWNNLTPVYFFRQLRNEGLTGLLHELERGENEFGKRMNQAKNRITEIMQQYHYWDWAQKDGDVLKFKSKQGRDITLTREQAMSLYATWNREHINGMESHHLDEGGFVYPGDWQDPNTKKGVFERTDLRRFSGNKIDEADMEKISQFLTEEQKGYVKAMVDFLSTDMARYGNETSMQLYGIKKYKEKYYYPFKSFSGNLYQKSDAGTTSLTDDNRLKHRSFTKQLVRHANNAVLLEDFSTVVASHATEMITYSALTVGVENMNKVLNVKNLMDDDSEISTRSLIEAYYGKGASDYLKTFMQNLNGGVQGDNASDLYSKLISLFKKGAVAGSLSVAMQQPLSIIRAAVHINPKYLATSMPDVSGEAFEEAKQYAGTAAIKDIGGFDVNTGRSSSKYLLDTEDVSAGRTVGRMVGREGFDNMKDTWNDVVGYLPEKMDAMTWGQMWKAVKKEQADQNPGMDITSEEFLTKCGERFNEIMRLTQVYDSVLAKSANIQSKNPFMKTITAFMNEPTLTANMLFDAATHAKENPAMLGKALVTYTLSAIMQAMIKGLFSAARRDDKDKTLLEKWASAAGNNLLDEMNVVTLIPGLKDAWTIFQGGDVARADLSIISDLKTAIDRAQAGKFNDPWAFTENVLGALSKFAGIPLKNIMRDTRALATIVDGATGLDMSFIPGVGNAKRGSEGAVIKYSLQDNLTIFGDSGKPRYYQMYFDAIQRGDQATADDVRTYLTVGLGATESGLATGMRNIIKPMLQSDKMTDDEAVDLLIRTGAYTDQKKAFAWVVKNTEAPTTNDDGTEEKSTSVYDGVRNAAKSGTQADLDAEVKRLQDYGYTETQIRKGIYDQVKDWYLSGEISEAKARDLMTKYGGTGVDTEAEQHWTLEEWEQKDKYGEDYKYSKYNQLWDAIDTGDTKTIKSEVNEILQYQTGKGAEDWKQAAQNIASAISTQYKQPFMKLLEEGKTAEAANMLPLILDAYEAAGYDRDYELKYIQKNWMGKKIKLPKGDAKWRKDLRDK